MSYGKWKALHPHTPEEEPKPVKKSPEVRELVCGYCGGEFITTKLQANKKYCSDECRNRANKRRNREAYHNKPPKTTDKPCGYCGKVFPSVRGAVYCCAECYSQGAKLKSRERARRKKEEAQKHD
jgi:hypothetical protein